jgi:type I restriction enzyme S subunit
MTNNFRKTTIGDEIDKIIDIGSNGSDENVSSHLNMKDTPDYAYMLRTINFNNNNFKTNLKYINMESYNYFKKSKVFGDEIVVNKIGSPGSIGIVPKMDRPISLGLNQFAIVFKNDVSQMFMYYYLKNIEEYLKKLAHGSVTKTLTKDDIKQIKIFLPEKERQEKIANLLSNIDSKINNNNDEINKLDDLIQFIYEYWFIQFEFPIDNGSINYESSKITWNEKLKKNIPKNWEVIELGKICDIMSGYPFSKESYSYNGKYKLITIKNVQDNGVNLKTDNNIETFPSNLPDYCKLKPLDILMSLTGNVGRVGIMYDDDCLLNQRVAIIKPKDARINAFLYATFKNRFLKSKMEHISTGTSQLNLSPINVGKILIPYNELAVIKFSNIVNPILSKIVSCFNENDRLSEIRDALLPMLINGQLTIND